MNRRIRLFHNRQLAEKLKVNLARWKRWSLAFLPPDPLSGQQSGHARQYYAQDAFRVHLGGHLVGELGFSIPESRRILDDLSPYLAETRFGFDVRAVPLRLEAPEPQRRYRLRIIRGGPMAFDYTLTALLEDAPWAGAGEDVRCRRCRVRRFTSPPAADGAATSVSTPVVSSGRVLDLSGVYWQFVRALTLTG